jgi:DNA-binding transcriptional MerR regulator
LPQQILERAVPIGTASRLSRVKVPTIRYYEEIGLLRPPPRSEGNRRHYSQGELRRLAFIRHARELGFEIDAIRTLLALQDDPGQSCEAADAIAQARLADVDARIRSLMALRQELALMVAGCRHGKVGECRVIEVLADHGQCAHPHHDGPPHPLGLSHPAAKGSATRGQKGRVTLVKGRLTKSAPTVPGAAT